MYRSVLNVLIRSEERLKGLTISSSTELEISMKSSVGMVVKDRPCTGSTVLMTSPSYMQGETYRPQSPDRLALVLQTHQ